MNEELYTEVECKQCGENMTNADWMGRCPTNPRHDWVLKPTTEDEWSGFQNE